MEIWLYEHYSVDSVDGSVIDICEIYWVIREAGLVVSGYNDVWFPTNLFWDFLDGRVKSKSCKYTKLGHL